MSRISQMVAYLNVKKHPTKLDIKHYYTHFTIDDEAKKVRRKYRKEVFNEPDEENKIDPDVEK